MTSQQFLDWLEQKLQDAGVEKVVPDEDVLAAAFRTQRRVARLQQILEEARADEDSDDAPVPADLGEQIRECIAGKKEAWDDALWDIVQEQVADEDDEDA
jgi:hypothetical protein